MKQQIMRDEAQENKHYLIKTKVTIHYMVFTIILASHFTFTTIKLHEM